VRLQSLGEPPGPVVYFPYTQRPSRIQFRAVVLVESNGERAEELAPALRETLQGLDPDIPVTVTPLNSVVSASLASRQFTMLLLTGFSLMALVLAVVGIYGVVSYSVAQRTREMGIRLALGADPGGVRSLVVRGSMRMVAPGLVLGVLGSVAVGRLMQGMLYDVAPTDPLAILVGTVLLAGAALLASWVPARLGTHVDPMRTMRAD
jgi:putative ABC transport system permease protein